MKKDGRDLNVLTRNNLQTKLLSEEEKKQSVEKRNPLCEFKKTTDSYNQLYSKFSPKGNP